MTNHEEVASRRGAPRGAAEALTAIGRGVHTGVVDALLDAILANLTYDHQPVDVRWTPPPRHFRQISDEMACGESIERTLGVVRRIGREPAPYLGEIDWAAELAAFADLDYPAYYFQPFHSVPGGWLSQQAAVFDRQAMEAIYHDAHPRKSLGMRDEIARLLPGDARSVVDLGAGVGDGAAALSRRLPEASVIAVEASPFMIVVGRRLNGDAPSLVWRHALAERTGLPADAVDAVNVELVLHECEDRAKAAVLAETRRILKPGGTLMVSDSAPGELDTYRGFFEPYRDQWRGFDPDRALAEAGFTGIQAPAPAPPLWTRVARKPF